MRYFIFFLLTGWMLIGCTSAHNSFIESMNLLVSDYNNFQKYRNRYYKLDDRDLVKINKDKIGHIVYHYKQYDKGFKKYCEYYVVVNPKNKIIIDWGFEDNLTSQYCEIRN